MQHFVKNDAHAPHIAFIRKRMVLQNLRCSVQWSPKQCKFLSLIRVIDDSTEPEISQLSHTLLEKNVGRLDISMYDMRLIQCLIAMHDVSHESNCFVLADALILSIVQVMFQIAIFAKFKHHKNIVFAAKVFVQFDDKRRGKGSQIFDLVLYLFLDALGYFVDRHALYCHLETVLVLTVVDAAGST